MKTLIIIITVFFFPGFAKAADINSYKILYDSQYKDTIKEDEAIEDSLIHELIESKTEPQKEKVQYLSQLTKYGFKNLFKQFNYDPSIPYSNQVNPNAELYMQDYLRTHTSELLNMKSRAVPYFNLIDNVFTEYGLPKELKYLAVIESSLKTGATSWVGAAGPWQFMPNTARNYGLVVNKTNDDRRDYFKSTYAAARFLLKLYSYFHDWLLVIAAYNGGPGNVYNAIKKSGSKDFWTLQYYLPQESRNHVKKFIATHYIMEANSNGFNTASTGVKQDVVNSIANNAKMTSLEKENALTQKISGKYNSKIIAKNISMEMELFNKYNPDFENQLSQNGEYFLILPAQKMEIFLINKYQILNESVQLLLNDNGTPEIKSVTPVNNTPSKRKQIQ